MRASYHSVIVSLGHYRRCCKDTSYKDSSSLEKLTVRHHRKRKKTETLVIVVFGKKSGKFSLGQYPPNRRSLLRCVWLHKCCSVVLTQPNQCWGKQITNPCKLYSWMRRHSADRITISRNSNSFKPIAAEEWKCSVIMSWKCLVIFAFNHWKQFIPLCCWFRDLPADLKTASHQNTGKTQRWAWWIPEQLPGLQLCTEMQAWKCRHIKQQSSLGIF